MALFKSKKEQDEFCLACPSPENREIHDKICFARRETGICPQATVIDELKRKLEWLEENRSMKNGEEHNEMPDCGSG